MTGLVAVALLAGCGGGEAIDGGADPAAAVTTTEADRDESGAVAPIDETGAAATVETGTIETGTVDTRSGDTGESATTTTLGAEPPIDDASIGTESTMAPVAPSISVEEVAALERDLDDLDQLLTDIELELDQD